MDSFFPDSYEFVERDNALSFWEFINASDAADSDIDVASLDDGVASLHSSLSAHNLLDLAGDHVHADVDVDSAVHETPILGQNLALVKFVCDDAIDDVHGHGYVCHRSYEEEEEDEEEYDDDDDDEDLNDELVPWSVSGKFGRQRMRKLGKRAFAKISNSKKVPYSHVKPGCLHGKHGLGVKHNC